MRRRHACLWTPHQLSSRGKACCCLNVQGRTKCGCTFPPAVFLPGILCLQRHLSEHTRQCWLFQCSSYAACNFGHFCSHRTCNELQMCEEMSGTLHHSTAVFIINGGFCLQFFTRHGCCVVCPGHIQEVYVTPEGKKYCFILTKHRLWKC